MRVECGGEGVVLEFQPSVSVTVSGVRRTCRESLPIVPAVSNHIRGRPRESFNISARKWPFGCGERGGWGRNRTGDTRIFSPLLYQLSYPAVALPDCVSPARASLCRKRQCEQAPARFSGRLRFLSSVSESRYETGRSRISGGNATDDPGFFRQRRRTPGGKAWRLIAC